MATQPFIGFIKQKYIFEGKKNALPYIIVEKRENAISFTIEGKIYQINLLAG